MTFKTQLFTVFTFFKISSKRFFRDKTAIFFTIAFPLIFLFIFGGIFGGSGDVSFKVAVLNNSGSAFSKQFVSNLEKQKSFKVDKELTNQSEANVKMSHGEIDATIELPKGFGDGGSSGIPAGQAIVRYTQNNASAAQTLTSVLQAEFANINAKLVGSPSPFTVVSKQTNTRSLSQFDYTFAGLLGFAILGQGIFGPVNVFPELKKMGILRRLHTTPIRVWQYFLSTMLSQALIGLLALGIMFVTAILVFHLKVIGNYLELALFLSFGITVILGIGLALGGWAKNERQAAPLTNIIVFPLMFLSGTFFPRFLMPQWLQSITTFSPLSPIIDGARMIATEGKGLLDLGPQLGVMAIWMIIVYAIAFRVFRWE